MRTNVLKLDPITGIASVTLWDDTIENIQPVPIEASIINPSMNVKIILIEGVPYIANPMTQCSHNWVSIADGQRKRCSTWIALGSLCPEHLEDAKARAAEKSRQAELAKRAEAEIERLKSRPKTSKPTKTSMFTEDDLASLLGDDLEL